MKSSTLEILKTLVSFRTVTGKHPEEFAKAWDYLDSQIKLLEGWSYREYISNGYVSRVYSHQDHINNNEKFFDLYLYANLDVVDAKENLFSAIQTGNKLVGRGVVDMKFALAVALTVLQSLPTEILKKKIALIITTDEEFGGINGAKYLVDAEGYRGSVIIGPNGKLDEQKFNFEIKNKGTIHTKYEIFGKAAHGSRPWEGDNAIEKAIQLFQELKSKFHVGDKNKWGSTVNLGKIEGGFATNAVADYASIYVDFRYIDQKNASEYYDFEKEIMEKYSAKANLIVDAINVAVDQNNELFKRYYDVAKKVVGEENIQLMKSCGSHDVREFFRVGMLPLLFMPRGGDNHMDTEWINIEDLEKLVQIDLEFIKAVLN